MMSVIETETTTFSLSVRLSVISLSSVHLSAIFNISPSVGHLHHQSVSPLSTISPSVRHFHLQPVRPPSIRRQFIRPPPARFNCPVRIPPIKLRGFLSVCQGFHTSDPQSLRMSVLVSDQFVCPRVPDSVLWSTLLPLCPY